MKNQPVISLFIVLLMIISLHGFTQPWNPKTAYWIYNASYIASGGDVRISYLKDTVVNGKDCEVLKRDMILYDYYTKSYSYKVLGQMVTRYESGVTYLLYNNHEFDTLYYFAGKINERYNTDRPEWGPGWRGYAVIADTGSITIDTQKLKWQAVDYFFERQGYKSTLRDTIIEKIGSTKNYFFPWDYANGMVDANEGGPLKCFWDNTVGLYSTNLSTDCKFDLSLVPSKRYEPYISENKVWKNVETLWLTGGSEGPNYLVSHAYFKGDTIVDQIAYKKLYRKIEQPIREKESLAFLMHEDTVSQRVYVNDFRFKKTALLYDFKLNKGDAFNRYIIGGIYSKHTVTKVDTITLFNRKLKRITFEDSIKWVEGIGAINGGYIPSSGELICVTDNNELMYLNPEYHKCDTIFPVNPLNAVSSFEHSEVIIYPNPVTTASVLRVNSYPTERMRIEIYSYSGALIKEDDFTGDYPIGMLNLGTGLYVYRIFNNQQLIMSDKIMVHSQ